MHYAHSRPAAPCEHWQPLSAHLLNVTMLAADFARPQRDEVATVSDHLRNVGVLSNSVETDRTVREQFAPDAWVKEFEEFSTLGQRMSHPLE
jgi:hypothetical protein